MEVRFTYNLQDVYHADWVFIRQLKRMKTIFLLTVALVLLGILSAVLSGMSALVIVCLSVGPLGIIGGITARRAMLRKMLSSYPGYGEERTVRLVESGIGTDMPSSTSFLKWNMINRVIESDRTFIVIYSPVHYFIIPKRAFAGASEIEAAAAMFRKNAANFKSAG